MKIGSGDIMSTMCSREARVRGMYVQRGAAQKFFVPPQKSNNSHALCK